MGISVTKLLIVLAIIVVIFGTKRLKDVGGDLGAAINSFRKAVKNEDGADNADANDKSNDEAASKKNDTN